MDRHRPRRDRGAPQRTPALLVLMLACAVSLAACGGGSQSQPTTEATEGTAEKLAHSAPGPPPGGTRIVGTEAEEVADAVRGYVGDLRVDGWLDANPGDQGLYSPEDRVTGVQTENGIRACRWLTRAAQREAVEDSEGAATTCGAALKHQPPPQDDMEVVGDMPTGDESEPRIPALFEWNSLAPGGNGGSYARHIDEATEDYVAALEEVPVTAYRQADGSAIAVIGLVPAGWRLAQVEGAWKIDSLEPVELTPESSPPAAYGDTMRSCIQRSPLVVEVPEGAPENVPYPFEQSLEEAGLNATDTMEMEFIHTQEEGREWGVPTVGGALPYDSFNFTTVENNSGGGATVSVLDMGTASRAEAWFYTDWNEGEGSTEPEQTSVQIGPTVALITDTAENGASFAGPLRSLLTRCVDEAERAASGPFLEA